MALSSFQNSAEPIKVYKVLVGAFVGNVGKNVGRNFHGDPLRLMGRLIFNV
jgi:hypothetical protein